MGRKIIQQQFGAHADDYVTSVPHAQGASLKRLVELVNPGPHWKVLDVATGAGHTAFRFAPHVAQVWATDITREMLEATKRGARERGIKNLIIEYADVEDLPYQANSFDLVTCRIAPHHFVDVQPFMLEAARVLNKDGILAVVDNIVPPGMVGDYINAFEKLRDPSHGRCLSMDEWRGAFEASGFNLVHQETLDKQMVFEAWAARHGKLMHRYLMALLTYAPAEANALLQPRTMDGQLAFNLREGILVGRC